MNKQPYLDHIAREEFDELFLLLAQEGITGYEKFERRYTLEYHDYTGVQKDDFQRQLRLFVNKLAGKQASRKVTLPAHATDLAELVQMVNVGNYYALFQALEAYDIPEQHRPLYAELKSEYMNGQRLNFPERIKVFIHNILNYGNTKNN